MATPATTAAILSVEEFVERGEVTNEQLDKRIQEDDLHQLAGYFSSTEQYLPKFKLLPAQVADVDRILNQKGTQAAMRTALKHWKTQNPFTATFKELIKIMLSLNPPEGDIAANICQYLKEQGKYTH